MLKIISYSERETRSLAQSLARFLRGGEILALSGNLGSGKTTFVKGLAKGLKIAKKIKSPSFVIMKSYQIPGRKLSFWHLDLYRLKKGRGEFLDLGGEEILNNPKNIIAIEWPEKIGKLLPKGAISIRFAHAQNPRERILTWTKK
jgi:tRNA threonylcarbamoyladenosine biosynthesis protein TsaE